MRETFNNYILKGYKRKGGSKKMRLWHYKLISYLPRQQLIAQWRECCAIANNLASKGTLNHLLVNKITEYPIASL